MENKIENKILKCAACSNKNHKIRRGSLVAKCEKCQTCVWVTTDEINLKNKEKFVIWCDGCVHLFKNEHKDSNVLFHEVPIEEIKKHGSEAFGDAAAAAGAAKWLEGMGQPFDILKDKDQFKSALDNFEESMFKHAKEGCDSLNANVISALPLFCTCAMSQLDIFHVVEHLSIACLIECYVMNVIVSRREKHGKNNAFSCWKDEEIIQILTFLFGVSKAKFDWHKKFSVDGWESLQEHMMDQDGWKEGLEKWRTGILEGFEDWRRWGESNGTGPLGPLD